MSAKLAETPSAAPDSHENPSGSLSVADRLTHLALASLKVGTWEWDVQSGRVEWSPWVERIFGLAPGEFGRTFDAYFQHVHADDRKRVLAEVDASLKSNEFVIEHRVVWQDGTIHWVAGKGRLERDPDGQPLRMAGTVEDITPRKQAEEALVESEALLRQFIKYTPAAVAMLDKELRYIQVSDRWLTDYHLQGETLIGRSHYEVFPDIPERWKEIHRRALGGVTERCEEDAFPRKDGSVEWLTWEVRPWLRADGAVGGMIMLTQVITERKRVAEALRASEARLKSAMQNSPIGMALVAPDGRFLDVNPALCRIVGYSAEELRATNFQTITHPQDLDADLDKLKQVLSRETETYAMEKRYIHKDGREIWIQLNVSADFNEDATPRHLIAQIQDITERKRVNAALKKAEEKFSSVFFGAPVGITICCTRDGRISDVNREFERLSGYARDEAVGRTGVELALWPDVEAAEDYLESVLSGNGPRNVELLLRTKAGKLIPLRHSGHTMHLDGETYLLSAFVDLSERKRAEAAIRESEARLRRVVASPILGIAFGRADGTITEANDEYLRIVGYSREELEAEAVNFRHMTPPEFVHQNARALGELDAKGTSRPWEMELLRKDGERVPVLLGVSVVDAQRGLDVVFVFDLSERRSLERQLLHAQKMEAVGRLAAGVAHDFNNVLSAITMCSDLLRDTPLLGPAATDEVNEIRKAADRGVGLTRQLLAFSRQQVLEPRIIDLNGLVGNLERMLRRLASEDVEVQTQFGPGRATVKADAGQIEQVLMNLVVNAKDAMPQGGTLTIETSIVTLHADHLASDQTQLPPGIYASLSVSDTGTGMTAETAARIFEPFFTTKEIGKGTGLGLSTVYGIVRQSGGAIDVTSVIGQGTSFRILLPHVHKALESIPMSGLPNMVGGKETILVVEGDAAVRQVTRKVLVKLGYRVLDAPNPAAALAMGNSYVGTIDLLLTDLIMPGGSGRTLAAALGAQRPKLCVLYMSGHADDADTTADPSANGDYVLKPFSSTALAHKVRALLDQQRGFAR